MVSERWGGSWTCQLNNIMRLVVLGTIVGEEFLLSVNTLFTLNVRLIVVVQPHQERNPFETKNRF